MRLYFVYFVLSIVFAMMVYITNQIPDYAKEFWYQDHHVWQIPMVGFGLLAVLSLAFSEEKK